MEKKDKIIIGVLIIVILALVACLAIIVAGNGNLLKGEAGVEEGMQVYDFDSAFTMVVKDDAKFLKSWETTPVSIIKTYYNKDDNYLIYLSESDYFANNLEIFSTLVNDTGKFEKIDDMGLNIVKVIDKSEKVDVGGSEKYFTYRIGLVDGNKFIVLYGDDLDSLKDMANSIKINGRQ
ncbi:hypothetical protein [uncultured Methanobrevibacter sp.]|uniref:hypothetical protein n=1 Tax=uncultured Methanobrevibacter sp. TaxID=253161 RepID=UPI0026148313|nr:hypothetical protein [uncultured Methanobrevibacter sp.]